MNTKPPTPKPLHDPPPPYIPPRASNDLTTPPPSYSRARELSESDDAFIPPGTFIADVLEEDVDSEDVSSKESVK